MNIEKAIEEFIKYVDEYINIDKMCVYKKDHTLRVVEFCGQIATNLGLNNDDICLAKMIGLLHDIGRFEQWKRYNTFFDVKSIDHADLGVEILTTNDYIRNYYEDCSYDKIVLTSIKWHNKYSIDEKLNEREKLFAKIIRDADKLDIIYSHASGKLKIDVKDEISDKIYTDLLANKLIKLADRKGKADAVASTLGLVFDINFKESFEILKSTNYINQIIDIYYNKANNLKFENQLETVRGVINNYIGKKGQVC